MIGAALTCLSMTALLAYTPEQVGFQSAKPIWPAGRSTEMNLLVGFRTVLPAIEAQEVTLRLTAATCYRAYVNGQFVGYGPARGPHGWCRLDQWDIKPYLKSGPALIAIEVAGYNCNSYSLLDQPSFLQAEVLGDGKILASTAGDGRHFDAALLPHRVQKVQRYSFQRPFSEVYRMTADSDSWREDPRSPLSDTACEAVPGYPLLPRRVNYPTFEVRPPVWDVSQGTLKTGVEVKDLWKDRSLVHIGPQLKGFPEKELATIPSIELQKVANATNEAVNKPWSADARIALGSNSFRIVDFGVNQTGFIGATVSCTENTRLFLTFDEILSNGDVDFKRMGSVNIILYELQPGTYHLESIEPNTLRYLKPLVLEGACEISDIYLREYVHPDVWDAQFASSDERLNRLFAAARETYRQNAVDIFMDCPSRERAGWLCDSFFTARVSGDLNRYMHVEKNFLENYLLPANFQFLPQGMLPMCYPADHNDGVYIPNWAMWLVMELDEYLVRSADRPLVDGLKPRVLSLLDFLAKHRNSDGLLEKLPSWVFVEWSKANEYVQDVNYPSNMLYAAVLEAAGRMYNLPEHTAEAARVRETIIKQSFDGEYFVDNALRKEGKLEVTRNRTEVCQYYAYFFNTAGFDTQKKLWDKLVSDFGPKRRTTKAHPEIAGTNQFPGNVLRMELLSRAGLCKQALEECVGYNLHMAEKTGTLWENDGDYASCNHGFASHVAHLLYRDVLGIYAVDIPGRKVTLRFTDVDLDWCEGRKPVPTGNICMRWWKEQGKIAYRINVPAGFSVEVLNPGRQEILRKP